MVCYNAYAFCKVIPKITLRIMDVGARGEVGTSSTSCLKNSWHTVMRSDFQQQWPARIIALAGICVLQLKLSTVLHSGWVILKCKLRDKREDLCFPMEWQNYFSHVAVQGEGFQISVVRNWCLPRFQLFKWKQNLLVDLLCKGVFYCLFCGCSQ